MKAWLLDIAFAVVVALAFHAAFAVNGGWWRVAALCGAIFLLKILYIQKYPKREAFKWAITNLKPGEKVMVEGK